MSQLSSGQVPTVSIASGVLSFSWYRWHSTVVSGRSDEACPDGTSAVGPSVVDEPLRIEIVGEMCTETALWLRRMATTLLLPAMERDVELDLSGVTFLDARGVSLLVSLRHDDGVRSLRTTAASPVVGDVLAVCGLVEALGIDRHGARRHGARRSSTPSAGRV